MLGLLMGRVWAEEKAVLCPVFPFFIPPFSKLNAQDKKREQWCFLGGTGVLTVLGSA
jgi:hypothetical protein